jgi:hypothetical protein
MNYRAAIIGTIRPWPTALSVLASITLLGQPACGQDATTSAPPPAATNQPPAALDFAPSLDFQPESLLTGFRLGPFDIQPRVSAGVTYDDNILLSSHNTESDFIWSVQPAFLAVAGDRLAIEDYRRTYHNVVTFSPDTFIVTESESWPGKTLTVDYGPRFNGFTHYTENNSVDELLSVNALWPMHRMILGFRQDYDLQNTTIIEAGRRTWEERIPTILSGGYQFSDKTTGEVNLSRNSLSYEHDSGLADSTDWNWDNWLNYQYKPRINLGLGANLGILELPSQPRQTYETPELRARYRYDARVFFDGSFGMQMRQYDGGAPNSTAPVFNLVAHYQASENVRFHLNAFRRESSSGSSGLNYVSTGISGGVQQQLGDRYFAGLEMTYYHDVYSPTSPGGGAAHPSDRVDDFIEIRPALEVRFSRHLVGDLYYLFRTDRSAQWDGWTENQVGARLTWSF